MEKDNLVNRREYVAIHAWLRYRFGKANKCEHPECKGISTRYEWALKSGCQYERNRDNFIMLCKRCHIIYDNHNPKILHTLRNDECMDRINRAKFKKIDQFTKDGVFVRTWGSAKEAGEILGIDRVGIGNSISKNKSYKKHLWKIHIG